MNIYFEGEKMVSKNKIRKTVIMALGEAEMQTYTLIQKANFKKFPKKN